MLHQPVCPVFYFNKECLACYKSFFCTLCRYRTYAARIIGLSKGRTFLPGSTLSTSEDAGSREMYSEKQMASVSKISHREGSVSSGTSVRACLVCSYDLTWCVVVPSSYTWLYCDTRAIYDFVATCDPFIGVWHVRLHLPAFAYVNLFCLFRDIVPPARQEAVLLLYVSVSCFPEVFSLSLVLCRFFLSRSFSLRFSSERVAVAVYSHISMSVCFASLAISSHQPDKKQSYRMSINSQFVQPPRKTGAAGCSLTDEHSSPPAPA